MNHPFYDMLPMVIGKIQKDFYNQMTSKLRMHNLTTAQLVYLLILSDNNKITLKELTSLANFDKAYTTKIVHELTERGFISNDKKTLNSRKYHIFLTDNGRKYINILQKSAEEARYEIISNLSESDKKNIVTTLEKALYYLKNQDK